MDKIIPAHTMYRLVDALRDYAQILASEGNYTASVDRLNTAERMEMALRAAGMVQVDRFDFDTAHSAVVNLFAARADKAQELREQAAECDREAKRWEDVLGLLTD